MSILRATASQFAQRGWEQLAIEPIATEAGVGKQTIYRWWPSKAALVAETLFEGLLMPEPFDLADTGDLDADLTAWLTTILDFAADPRTGELFRSLIAAAAGDEQIGLRLRDALGATSALQARLEKARAQGQLAADAPLRQIGDVLIGAVVLHLLVRAENTPGLPAKLAEAVTGTHRSRG